MRLNSWLARRGRRLPPRRRRADQGGRVTVNGEPGQLNTFVASRDRVELDGRLLAKQQLAYVLLHKPAGVVTTARDPQGRPTVVGLVAHAARVVPVGRLDADTTGAILLTNDGDLAHGSPTRATRSTRSTSPRSRATRPPRCSRRSSGRRARRRHDRAGPRAPSRSRPGRARDPRGPQASGEADAGRRRLPGDALAPEPLRGLTVDGLEPGAWRELERAEVERLRSERLKRLVVALAAGLALVPAASGHGPTATQSGYVSNVRRSRRTCSACSSTCSAATPGCGVSNYSGKTVVILGYQGEPYLRFGQDGVFPNTRSPAVYVNRFRGLHGCVPGERERRPRHRVWRKVADGASFEWRDHRIYWVRDGPAPGREGEPGPDPAGLRVARSRAGRRQALRDHRHPRLRGPRSASRRQDRGWRGPPSAAGPSRRARRREGCGGPPRSRRATQP